MNVYIQRHTLVSISRGICYGRLSVPLAPSFTEEVKALRQALPGHLDAVWSSPLERCVKLAKQFSAYPQLSNALLELDFGTWEGKAWDDIQGEELRAWMDDFVHVKAGGGESFQELYERVGRFVEHLRVQDMDNVLIITHAGVIRSIWGNILQIPLKQLFKISIGYGETLHLQLGKSTEMDMLIRKQ
jgi:alpha-ribazole phosphatase